VLKRVDCPDDRANGKITYDPGNGKRVTFDEWTVRRYGIARLLADMGIDVSSERVPVMQHGKRVGTLGGDFDPLLARSHAFMYDVRAEDFTLDGDVWVVSPTLSAGDLEAVEGFKRDSDASPQD
jgi:hypothetical protein